VKNSHATNTPEAPCGVTETDLMKRTVTADIDLDVTGPGGSCSRWPSCGRRDEVDENLVLPAADLSEVGGFGLPDTDHEPADFPER
jgi:hypothetical protein